MIEIDRGELRELVSPLFRRLWRAGAKQIVITAGVMGACKIEVYDRVRVHHGHWDRATATIDADPEALADGPASEPTVELIVEQLLEVMHQLDEDDSGNISWVSPGTTVFEALGAIVYAAGGEAALAARFPQYREEADHGT